MVMRPPLTDVAQRTLKGLENLLLDTDNRSKWRRDIIFAVAFIVISHIGKTQVALIQAAHSPDPHESAAIPAFGTKEAEEQVIAIESDLVNILILYLKQFMVPSARRKHYSSGSPNKSRKTRPGDLEAEQHAEQFDFMEKVQAIKERYGRSSCQSDLISINHRANQADLTYSLHYAHQVGTSLLRSRSIHGE